MTRDSHSLRPDPLPSRFLELDVLRGLAVIGVVLNHAINGLQAGGLLAPDTLLVTVNSWLYQFRMPAIAFVLGLFVPRAIQKRTPRLWADQRVRLAVYLYLVWFVIQMGVELAMNPWKNVPIEPVDALRIWAMPAHLWFMPYLAVSAVLLALTRPWEPRRRWWLLPLLLSTPLLWGWNPDLWGLRGLSLLGFSALGALLGAPAVGRALRDRAPLWAVVAVVLTPLFFVNITQHFIPSTLDAGLTTGATWNLAWLPASIGSALLGILALAGWAVLISRLPGVRTAVSYAGRHTLEIYLSHIIVIAGTRIVLVKLGITSIPILLVAMMILGVGAPLLLERLVRATPLRHLFVLPTALSPRSYERPGG